mgnify:CR=1 FL=1
MSVKLLTLTAVIFVALHSTIETPTLETLQLFFTAAAILLTVFNDWTTYSTESETPPRGIIICHHNHDKE